jgi:amino acid transporter
MILHLQKITEWRFLYPMKFLEVMEPLSLLVLIMVSTFGCNNGLILAGARVYYTMAKDGLFFKQTGQLNKFGVPAFALWIQCLIACLLCLSGKYGDLLDMISFVVVMFYAFTIFGIFILRKKDRMLKGLTALLVTHYYPPFIS